MTCPNLLTACIEALAPNVGETVTDWPGLVVGRITQPVPRAPFMYMPSLCVVAQGHKFAHWGETPIAYGPDKFLLCSLPLPIETEITQASDQKPLLAAALKLDLAKIGALLLEMESGHSWPMCRDGPAAIANCDMSERVLDALVRFLTAVADPLERQVLGGALERVLLFEILRSPQGHILRSFVMRDGSVQRVVRAVSFLERNFREPIDIQTIAKTAGMSPSALHQHFKHATSMSPLQFVKKIRLHEARSQLIAGRSASDAAFDVGYSSASQFSREFRRLFGQAPNEVAADLRRKS